jgi:hypothetical protein
MAKKKRARKKAPKPPPKCKAILLCNQTIVDASTGQVSIIGTFDELHLPTLPGSTRPFTVYLQLTDGIGEYALAIEIHDLNEDQVLARVAGPAIEFTERIGNFSLVIEVPALPLTHAGFYDLVVFADRQEIDRQKFLATSLGEQEDGNDANEETTEP